MLASILYTSFSDSARQAHFEAVAAALAAAEPEGLVLGNLEVAGETLDAVVVLPRGVAVLQLLPGGGRLTVPRLATGAWLLDGQPLPGFDPADENPLRLWQRQREAAAAWLASQPETADVLEAAITGLAVFGQPVTFGAEVEANLRVQADADTFQLVPAEDQLPRRLRQLEPLLALDAASLQRWAQRLLPRPAADYASVSEAADGEPEPAGFWTEKARQLWRWLGAEDVPADPPYGGPAPAPDAVAASQQEKQRLEQMRQQVRTEVSQHTQAMEAREAERDQTIAQLRQQLAAASAAAPETARLQAQLAAEAREKAALEEAIRAARAESAARNQQLDARIQQLGQLIEQLQSRPATPAPAAAPAPARRHPTAPTPPRPVTPASAGPAWRLHWGRLAAVVAVAGALGAAATWGIRQVPFGQRPASREAARLPRQDATIIDENLEAAAPTLFDIQPDTVHLTEDEASQQLAETDSTQAPPTPREGEVMDSVQAPEEDI